MFQGNAGNSDTMIDRYLIIIYVEHVDDLKIKNVWMINAQ